MRDERDDDENGEPLLDRLERDALFAMPAEDDADEEELDVVRAITGADADARDVSLGGYIEKHDRVPAFEGSDGMPYTVDVDTEAPGEPAQPWVAFLVFIRWAATGAGVMGHLETGDVATGDTEEAARQGALDLTLYEIKAELDAAIARRRDLEDHD